LLAWKLLRKWYVRAALEVGAILFLWFFVIQVRPTSGSSMLPTLKEGAYAFVDRISYRFCAPARGDVIMFKSNERPGMFFCKRVIGLPGETIAIRDGQVYINELPLREPYIIGNRLWQVPPTRIGGRQAYVLGDNRGMALIRHYHGLVAYRNILGRLIGKRYDFDEGND